MKNNKNDSFTQLGIMIVLTMITQVFTLIRASIVASNFGISVELDAFNFINNLATLIFSFIGAGITTILIPNLGDKKKDKAVNSFISILYITATAILLIMIIFRRGIISVLQSNGNGYFVEIASSISIILIFSQYIASFAGLTNAVLQFNGMFNRSKLAVLISNIITVLMLIFITGNNINGYALAMLITALSNVIMQFVMISKTNFTFKLAISFKDSHLKSMLRAFVPIILSTGLYQISLMIDTIIASGLGTGQISILNYSNYVVGMINMLLIANITAFLYPKIAKGIKNEDSQDNLAKYITIINAILLLIVATFIIVGENMLKILYMRGQFTEEISRIVFYCSSIYIISIPVTAARDLIYKYFYSNNNTYEPFFNGLTISILNMIISIILSKVIGLYGVVVGTTITNFLSLILICIKFNKKYKFKFNINEFIKENVKLLVTTILSILIFSIINKLFHFDNSFLDMTIKGIGVVAVYVLQLYLYKSKVITIKI